MKKGEGGGGGEGGRVTKISTFPSDSGRPRALHRPPLRGATARAPPVPPAPSIPSRSQSSMPVWGYTKTTGPHTWSVYYPAAGGQKQSPIDLVPEKAEQAGEIAPLSYHYRSDACTRVTNTGQGWKLLIGTTDPVVGRPSTNLRSLLGEVQGGPLNSTFKLEQIHAHWGKHDAEGSEHRVEGKAYPCEVSVEGFFLGALGRFRSRASSCDGCGAFESSGLKVLRAIHLVHWDSDKFGSFAEAAGAEGGLTVLGVFVEVGDENSEFAKIIQILDSIPHKGDTTDLEPVNPSNFLPGGQYWTYEGSLTTPPCSETVNWILFKNPITASSEQLSAFRAMKSQAAGEECSHDEFEGRVLRNFRPPMPLCGRTVRECA
ncbi:unnamed protein product [Darwinula stevensoni]|uniref:carbonic anhydrase n=1 Tax=Darwinula stevensoni TaxID=69355 RepID=A0A7R8X6A0_9CRUS|nr:unnamed protein product [Darwinula stevensoni]CAG0881067.1 unnamed protein product [Darwinula stevensoni]